MFYHAMYCVYYHATYQTQTDHILGNLLLNVMRYLGDVQTYVCNLI